MTGAMALSSAKTCGWRERFQETGDQADETLCSVEEEMRVRRLRRMAMSLVNKKRATVPVTTAQTKTAGRILIMFSNGRLQAEIKEP